MADNVELNAGSGGSVIATDDNAGVHHQYVKVEWGGDGTFTPVTAAAPLPVDLGANNDVTLATLPDTAAGDLAAMVVDLAAIEGLLGTIDADTSTLAGIDFATGADVASLAVVGGGTEATALRVTLANDSTGLVSVDDGGGSLTVDGTFWQATQPVSIATVPSHEVTNAGTFAVQAVCTNAGTFATQATLAAETTKVIGTVNISAAQTIAAVTTITNPVTVDLGANNDVTVTSGTVTANAGTNLNTSALALEAGGNLAAIATDAAAIEVLLGTIDADTSTLAGAVSGSEMQVDIVASLPAGTNAIGKLAANSGVDIGDVDVTSLPALAAGTNLVGKVSAGLDGTNLYDGTTALTLKRATGIATASGANTMISAVADKQIRVLALAVFATSTTGVAAYIYNGDNNMIGDGTNKLQLDADGGDGPAGFVLPFNAGGWCQTDANNEALAINLSGATPVIWCVTYVEV